MTRDQQRAYWRQTLRTVGILLATWFAVSFLAGILLADPLDRLWLGGFPLGFWFANQGSELAFVAVVFTYVWRMNRLDRKFGVYEP